jgi:hypothetical protein
MVVARQPFGVFVRFGGVPDALGLAEITAMARNAILPEVGTAVSGEVIQHAEHNYQIKLRISDSVAADEALVVPEITHTGHVFINFANRTFQWVDIQLFHLSEAAEDLAILRAVIAHERFGNDYATGPGGNPERHGPYWRNRITADCYALITAEDAERRLRSWAEQFAALPDHIRPQLGQSVYERLRAADRIYWLRDLGPAAFHDWGCVHNEFHELVLIDQVTGTVMLVVAADD